MQNNYIKDTTKLMHFQKQGVKFLLQHKTSVLGDDVGLGKTIQAITTFSYYKTKFPNAKMIVLTNKSLVPQFESEVHKFFKGFKTMRAYELDKEERYQAYNNFFNSDIDIFVTNYGSIKSDIVRPSWMKSSIYSGSDFMEPTTIKGAYGTLTIGKNNRCTYKLDLDKAAKTLSIKVPHLMDAFNFKDTEGKSLFVKCNIDFKDGIYSLYLENVNEYKTELKETSPFVSLLKENHNSKSGLISIFDEAIAFKDTTSIVHKAGKLLSQYSTKVIAITATVTKGDLEEAYNIFKCIGVNLTKTKKIFSEKYCIFEKSHFKIRGRRVDCLTGYKNIQSFNKLIEPHYIGRSKKLVAPELPAFTHMRHLVYECEGVHKALQTIYTDSVLNNQPPNIGRIRIANITPQLIDESLPKDYLSSKLQEFIRVLNEDFNNEKILVYIDYKSPIDLMEEILPQHLQYNYKNILKITGDVTDRAGVLDKFNTSPNHNLLFINSAGKEGLNIQIAGHLMFMVSPFTAGDYIQISGRISRVGTMHQNLVLHNFVVNDSTDTDSEGIIQTGLKIIQQLTPASVGQGLVQPEFLPKKIQEELSPEQIMLNGFKSRAKRYIKKNLEI